MYADSLVQKIGQISLQHDWFEASRHGSESVWVSCSTEGQKTMHGEICVKQGGGTEELDCSPGFEAHLVSKYVLMVRNKNAGITSYFFAPCSVFSKIHDKAVRCLDVSTGGGIAVSCGDDQGLFVWQTENGVIRRTLDGHINDASHCRFFPSGVVVLSGGVDMRLKIWSVEDGSCPVTLVGHTAAITDTAIVERGKNIISCGRDGKALLWDCGTSQCIGTLHTCSSVINSCSISQYQNQGGVDEMANRSERESGTEGKLLLTGREDGYLDAIDVYGRRNVFSTSCHSAINDCCFVDECNIAVGLQDGKVVYFDLRNTRIPSRIYKYGKSSVNCIQSFHGDSLLVGRGDGSCNCLRNNETSSEVISMELSGPNCDPLFDVVSHENFVYTACRDSNVRKYRLLLND